MEVPSLSPEQPCKSVKPFSLTDGNPEKLYVAKVCVSRLARQAPPPPHLTSSIFITKPPKALSLGSWLLGTSCDLVRQGTTTWRLWIIDETKHWALTLLKVRIMTLLTKNPAKMPKHSASTNYVAGLVPGRQFGGNAQRMNLKAWFKYILLNPYI